MGVSGGGARVKSIQTVLVTIPAGALEGAATVAAVNVGRAVINHCGQAGSDSNPSYILARCYLFSATEVRARRQGAGGGGMAAVDVQVQLIEYE